MKAFYKLSKKDKLYLSKTIKNKKKEFKTLQRNLSVLDKKHPGDYIELSEYMIVKEERLKLIFTINDLFDEIQTLKALIVQNDDLFIEFYLRSNMYLINPDMLDELQKVIFYSKNDDYTSFCKASRIWEYLENKKIRNEKYYNSLKNKLII